MRADDEKIAINELGPNCHHTIAKNVNKQPQRNEGSTRSETRRITQQESQRLA